MRRTCDQCSSTYDDADCNTICPHPRLRSAEMEEQWKLGARLLGNNVRFRYMPPGSGSYHCHSLTFEGLVGIEGFQDEFFSPQLFEIEGEVVSVMVLGKVS